VTLHIQVYTVYFERRLPVGSTAASYFAGMKQDTRLGGRLFCSMFSVVLPSSSKMVSIYDTFLYNLLFSHLLE
jgi:hypothetical protein